MAQTGLNLGNVKENNRSAILKLLNEAGPMSRKDIAHRLGLTPATVTLICADLLAVGILREQGKLNEGRRAGRKKILLGIDYAYRYVLTVCVEGSGTCVAISDLHGNLLRSKRIETDMSIHPAMMLERVLQLCQEVLDGAGLPREMILGVGTSIPGAVERSTGVCKSTYQEQEERMDVARLMEERLCLPVIVENNVKAFAEAELIYGSGKTNDNLLFLKWGPGVGSALVVHDCVYEGRTAKEGALGHITVEKNGKLCRCGRRGCLETRASVGAISELLREHCTRETMPVLFEKLEGEVDKLTAADLEHWLQVEDPGMWEILDPVIELVARNACHALTLLAPETLIVYGPMFNVPRVRERFWDFCQEYDPAYERGYIAISELGDRVDYIGPLAVVVNQLFFATGGSEQSKSL